LKTPYAHGSSRSIRGHNEGSVYRRASDGWWVAAVSLPDGTRRVGYAKTQALAKTKLAKMVQARAEGIDPAPSLTVTAFLGRWLADVQPRIADSTYRRYESLCRVHIIPALGSTKLRDLSVPMVERYLAGVAATSRGHTAGHHRAVLRTALATAMRWSLLGRNPAALALPPTPAIAPRTGLALSVAQARTLMAGTKDDRLHAAWTLLLYTGMREAELLGIAWEDVDFAAGTVRVHQQLVRVAGEWRLAPPKTKAGARTVALAPDAMAALRDHQRRMAAERTPDWPFYGLVFVTERGKPIYGWRLLQMLGAHARRLGLPPVHVHDLRHSAATLMLEAGLTLEDVKQTLGHSTIAITSDVYSHPSKERQHEVARRMQETVGGA